jgi:hypothetical protein
LIWANVQVNSLFLYCWLILILVSTMDATGEKPGMKEKLRRIKIQNAVFTALHACPDRIIFQPTRPYPKGQQRSQTAIDRRQPVVRITAGAKRT